MIIDDVSDAYDEDTDIEYIKVKNRENMYIFRDSQLFIFFEIVPFPANGVRQVCCEAMVSMV